MAKIKKPAPKGGKKAAAPKKVAKRAPAKKQLTARQIDQFNADKMRADAFNKAQANKPLTGNLNKLDFAAPLHPTVEEQWADDFKAAVTEATFKPKKKSLLARFRSAISGLFVSKKYAEANPDTTVRERVKP